MKKSLRNTASLLAIAASFSLAGMAQAQSTNTNTNATPSYRAGGGYFELNAGQSDYSVGNGIGAWNSDEGDTAYGARIGNYFNDNLGFEVGYTDFGSINRGGGSTRARGINLSLVGKFPLSPAFNLLGKIGTTYSDTETSAQLASGIPTG
jgi:OOP family OmpA-OmpF porin